MKATYLMPAVTSPLVLPEEKQAAEHRLKVLHCTIWITSGMALLVGFTTWLLSH